MFAVFCSTEGKEEMKRREIRFMYDTYINAGCKIHKSPIPSAKSLPFFGNQERKNAHDEKITEITMTKMRSLFSLFDAVPAQFYNSPQNFRPRQPKQEQARTEQQGAAGRIERYLCCTCDM